LDVSRVFVWSDPTLDKLLQFSREIKTRNCALSEHNECLRGMELCRFFIGYYRRLQNGFVFDTVQMPLNLFDAHYRSFGKLVLPQLVNRRIGVLGMKPMGDSIILKSKTASPVECLHYAMNLPTSVVITGCDSMQILQQALDAARSFKPMSKDEVAELLAKTSSAASKGEFEQYKTTHNFDGTYQNPQWLG